MNELFDDLKRPNWDCFFLSLTFHIAMRSIDPSTKHGCVVISQDKTILSTGYNSPPRNADDHLVPLGRPEKYPFMTHAEVNAISNAARHGVALKGSTFYITGMPCFPCLRSIINVGAKRVVYGNVSSKCVGNNTLEKMEEVMKNNSGIEFTNIDLDMSELFDRCKDYYVMKCLSSEDSGQ